MIGHFKEISSTPMQAYVNEDTNRFEFISGQYAGNAGRMFSFTTVGEFVKKFAKKGSCDLLTVLRDYGTFVSCKATTVTEKKEPEHAD